MDTLAVHAGRHDFAALGVHAPPLDLSSTYPLPDLDEAVGALDALAAGAPAAASGVYGRLFNPTVRRLEEALAELEATADCVAFASGMAALTACLLAACGERRHVVALRPLYGGTDHLLACGLLGIEVTWATAESLSGALRPRDRARAARDAAEPDARPGRHRGRRGRGGRACRYSSTTRSRPRSSRTRPVTVPR